ncbi:phosphopantetheine adenylyltransferase [Bacillus sp. JCM 19046]|uniref:Phosphopantetheine adenylyltransferase n=1 Tax=Shouchella xiaoxiensis TaxID=766895 RepID=A0ABS2STD8_9BACI|nr:pantetheine-phosphate adenylyltransferase [Shouchella xiaoxiensis]MBM7837537.1 pantetheine-phosphate adenylyltransferase [Shouchella xiaoxiensis]GAF14621.1 phosphopantetheine adenylyltransferase [Bacillus sp. JCM 19045]GAF16493.1 phosphopantetheine adenylyltransferase [Bacillus sp. JCM 19046]
MTRIAISSGSFDPVTNGHIDLFERASKLFDEIIVVISINNKKTPLLSLDLRKQLLVEATAHIKNLRIDTFEGLLVDYAKKQKADAIVRGLRSSTDFDYENNIASMNKQLVPELETIFLMTKPAYSFVSSSIVKEAASYGSCIQDLVPKGVEKALKRAYNVN